MTCNHERSDSQGTPVLLALLAGIGTGLVAGILLAPKAGDKMRKEIGNAVTGYMDAACDTAESARKSVVSAVDSGARLGHDAVNSAASSLRASVGA